MQDPRELRAYFRALADSTRLRIIKYLWQHSDSTVTELCKELRVSQPLMSWHLRILRRVGLVITQRSGREVHCTVSGDIVRQHSELLAHYLEAPGAHPQAGRQGG
jgi:DNA-binding transcriptional ArsR family regulator